ncbi:MAG: sigma-70 family RNA polymerase sigma factor [Myxococcales bacterium]|nr:sigma-70 family RNA polymerase sigma factor [Myxococcales bacterium]
MTHGRENNRLRLVGGSAVDATEVETPAPKRAARAAAPVPASSRSPLAALPDDALVAMAQRGEMSAYELLYRRHASFALNLAARIAGSSHEAEDVTHDAFLRAFDGLAGLRNPKAFRSWLGSIVVHAMRSRLRRAAILRFLGIGRADPIEIDCIASPDASQHTRYELAQVYALLRTLAPADRIAWTLRFVEGHDLHATAELCGCSLATVKRRIRRAQNHLDASFVEARSDADADAPPSEAGREGDEGDET